MKGADDIGYFHPQNFGVVAITSAIGSLIIQAILFRHACRVRSYNSRPDEHLCSVDLVKAEKVKKTTWLRFFNIVD